MSRHTRTTRVEPHAFELDDEVSREWTPRTWCRWCCLPGEVGDQRHPVDAPTRYPEQPAEAREFALRLLGERDDDDQPTTQDGDPS